MKKKRREVNEFSLEEAEQLVRDSVEREGFYFWFMVNKTAAVFRDDSGKYGIVLGNKDSVSACPGFQWEFVVFRECTVIYQATNFCLE